MRFFCNQALDLDLSANISVIGICIYIKNYRYQPTFSDRCIPIIFSKGADIFAMTVYTIIFRSAFLFS